MDTVSVPPDAMRGVVIRAHGKFFAVQVPGEASPYLATPRGSLKRGRRTSDPVVVGDQVWITDTGKGEARIEAVLPRTSQLTRPARGSATAEQIILANPDQALFIFSITHPEPHRRMLDRFLILAEDRGLPARIGVNKIDLDWQVDSSSGTLRSREVFGDYERIYPVHYFSVRMGVGLDEIRDALTGSTTVIAGPSGVGKSSLLNALDPGGSRAVREVSGSTGKGRHTTTTAELFSIGDDTFVADTPGMRSLAMHGVPPEMLERRFREFIPFLGRCYYADCKHLTEPGCAILEAVEQNEISPERYASYASLRRGGGDD